MDAKLLPTTCGYEILYVDRPSEDEERLMSELFRETRNTNKAGSLNLNVTLF
jgi:hypothetical protein